MNNNLNPLSKLLDIDFPEIKRSNWNNSFDVATTADVGYVQPVFVDRVMAGTRCQLDFDSASFANSTIAPLYGRYKVKYLAFWAPDRLYMADWLSGEKMIDDDYPYPTVSGSTPVNSYSSPPTNTNNYNRATLAATPYVPTASLASYLGLYPALYHYSYFTEVPSKNAFAFLAFWDAYRTFMINPQEKQFPICTRAFTPEIISDSFYNNGPTNAEYTLVDVSALDDFFKQIKRTSSPNALAAFRSATGVNPLFAPKRCYQTSDFNGYFADDYHFGLPLGTYLPDIYTSWLSNENVELERTKSTVKVTGSANTSTGAVSSSFTMEQWYLASRIQSKIRKNMYQFEDFSQWIDTNFGVKPSTTLTQPMFLGAFMSDVVFNDAISTVQSQSETSDNLENNANLGSRAGYGVGYNGDRRNFFDFTAKEPGTVMIIQQIIPEVFYFEGSDKIHEKLNFNEEFNPIFDALGFQDLEKADMNLVPHLSHDPVGQFVTLIGNHVTPTPYSVYNSAIAQQPYGFEHMGKANRLLGMMSSPNYYQSWALARSFNYIRGNVDNNTGIDFLSNNRAYSTYVIPQMYNNIFANDNGVDNFQFYLSYRYTKYQPVSKQFLSFT